MDEEQNMMDSTEEGGILTSYPGVFTNSSAIFIEYDDIIKCPFYIFLCIMGDNEEFNKMFDASELNDMDSDEISQFYISRKEKNIFKALKHTDYFTELFVSSNPDISEKDITDDSYNLLSKLQLDAVPEIVTCNPYLNFHYVLNALKDTDLVTDIFIWSPYDSDVIRNDITKYKRAEFLYGDIREVLKNPRITEDTTFVFSDIRNILALKDVGKLNYSSILIPDGYRYNYDNDERNKFVIDIDSLYAEKYIFHLTLFDNIYS